MPEPIIETRYSCPCCEAKLPAPVPTDLISGFRVKIMDPMEGEPFVALVLNWQLATGLDVLAHDSAALKLAGWEWDTDYEEANVYRYPLAEDADCPACVSYLAPVEVTE